MNCWEICSSAIVTHNSGVQEDEISLTNNNFEDMEDLFQIEPVDGEYAYACNICNDGFDTEEEIKKHLSIVHTEILQNVSKQSNKESVQNVSKHVQDNKTNDTKCQEQNKKIEEPYKCNACSILGYPEVFTSSDYKEINEYIFLQLNNSRKKESKVEAEPGMDDSYE